MIILKEAPFENFDSSGPESESSNVINSTKEVLSQKIPDLTLPLPGSREAEFILYFMRLTDSKPNLIFDLEDKFKTITSKLVLNQGNESFKWSPLAAARIFIENSLGFYNGLIKFQTINGDELYLTQSQIKDIESLQLYSPSKPLYINLKIYGKTHRLSCKPNVRTSVLNIVKADRRFIQFSAIVKSSSNYFSDTMLIKYFSAKYLNADITQLKISDRLLKQLDEIYSKVLHQSTLNSPNLKVTKRSVNDPNLDQRKSSSSNVSRFSKQSNPSSLTHNRRTELFSDDFLSDLTLDQIVEIVNRSPDSLSLRDLVINYAYTSKIKTIKSYFEYNNIFDNNLRIYIRRRRGRKIDVSSNLHLLFRDLIRISKSITNESLILRDVDNKIVNLRFRDIIKVDFYNYSSKPTIVLQTKSGTQFTFYNKSKGLFLKKLKSRIRTLKNSDTTQNGEIPTRLLSHFNKFKILSQKQFGSLDFSSIFMNIYNNDLNGISSDLINIFYKADVLVNGFSESNVLKFFATQKSLFNIGFFLTQFAGQNPFRILEILNASEQKMMQRDNLNLYKSLSGSYLPTKRVTSKLKRIVKHLKSQRGLVIEIGHKFCGPCKEISSLNSELRKPFLFPLQFDNFVSLTKIAPYLERELGITKDDLSSVPLILRIDENGRVQK